MPDRRQESYAVRLEAAELARSREQPAHLANGDEQRYAGDKYFMSFTKGLPHNEKTGLLEDPQDFVEFRRAIDDGFIDPFSDRVRHGARYEVKDGIVIDKLGATDEDDKIIEKLRQWEAPPAGVAFDLEGPDAQAVTMPPAPPLMVSANKANPELIFEMAEVYELAVLRDVPFNAFEGAYDSTNSASKVIQASVDRLNDLDYIKDNKDCCEQLGRPRKVDADGKLDRQTVFRGSSPGVEVGPYLSQFLLIGTTDLNRDSEGIGGGDISEGLITYGAMQMVQKVAVAAPGEDYMKTMPEYIQVQRGISPNRESYVSEKGEKASQPERPAHRFISTPRDLATYVHYDALYQAYLNACIILLGMEAPFDPSFDHLSGRGAASGKPKTRRNAGGFALYGGPHILTLVTEVATRALKAVRFQKFNSHIRLRPEALAARIELVRLVDEERKSEPKKEIIEPITPKALIHDVGLLSEALEANGTLNAISTGLTKDKYLLHMAFPEGSPMHPAYGAGHATVAGACVTILKAFFDTSAVLVKTDKNEKLFRRYESGDKPLAFRAPKLPKPDTGEGVPSGNLDDTQLPVKDKPDQFLTLEGELNKLAANISIGRNMAGVHYFSDYYDSLRMGEEIAIGMLEEQALTYSTDPFVLSVPTFDGDVVRIGRR